MLKPILYCQTYVRILRISSLEWQKVVAVRNVHLTGAVKIVPLLMCAMSASVSFTP